MDHSRRQLAIQIAREVLRAFHNDPNGFKDMTTHYRKLAVNAADAALENAARPTARGAK